MIGWLSGNTCLRCLDMTGTDECHNSCSGSGTLSQGPNVVPWLVFQPSPASHSHSGTPSHCCNVVSHPVFQPHPTSHSSDTPQGPDSDILTLYFRPQMVLYIHHLYRQETPLHQLVMIHLLCIFLSRIQTYLRHRMFHRTYICMDHSHKRVEIFNGSFQVACPFSSCPETYPNSATCSNPTTCSGCGWCKVCSTKSNYIGHTAHQVYPWFPDKLWCTKGRHWVDTVVIGILLTCNACWAADSAHAVQKSNNVHKKVRMQLQCNLLHRLGWITHRFHLQ
jgi:hypothetical protein